MNRRPLVSILMAARNAAPWVAQAVESALAQTWQSVEVIVIDDGSTDDTAAVVQRAGGSALRLIRQRNQGQSAALNRALAESRGELVKFFDADDLLSPDCVERQVARLGARRDCIASGEWGRFRDDPAHAEFVPEPVWRDLSPVEWLVSAWSNGQPMTQCAIWLVPRRILDVAGLWDTRLTLINDFEVFTRLVVHATEIRFVAGARVYYRSGLAGSMSSSRGRAAAESEALSEQLATEHLLGLENSARTRTASANILQSFIYSHYPAYPDLRGEMERRVRALGGATLAPSGPPGFHVLRRIVGWKLARRIERAATARGLTRAGLARKGSALRTEDAGPAPIA